MRCHCLKNLRGFFLSILSLSHKMYNIICLCLCLAFVSCLGDIMQFDNVLFEDEQFVYLGKFCFEMHGGKFHVTRKLSSSSSNSSLASADLNVNAILALYSDASTNFADIINSGNSCAYKRGKATGIINLASELPTVVMDVDMNPSRPRFMYLVATACNDEYVLLDGVTISMTNSKGEFTHQFSYDKFGIYESLIVHFIVLLLMLIILIYWVFTGTNKTPNLQIFYGLFFASIQAQFLSVIFALTYSIIHASNGYADDGLLKATLFTELLSQLIMSSTLLLFSKGMLHRRVLPWHERKTLIEIIILYFIASVWVASSSYKETSPLDSFFVYNTPAGAMMVFLRIIMLVYVLKNFSERKNDPETFAFMRLHTWIRWLVIIVSCIWLLSLPCLMLLSKLVDSWEHEKVVTIPSLFFTEICYAILLFIFRQHGQFVSWLMMEEKQFQVDVTSDIVAQDLSVDVDYPFEDIHLDSNSMDEKHHLRI